MDIISIQEQLDDIKTTAEAIYGDGLEAKAKFENLKDFDKIMLATVELKHLDQKTQAATTRQALADPEYKIHHNGLTAARTDYYKKWAKVQSLEARKDCLQSMNKYAA